MKKFLKIVPVTILILLFKSKKVISMYLIKLSGAGAGSGAEAAIRICGSVELHNTNLQYLFLNIPNVIIKQNCDRFRKRRDQFACQKSLKNGSGNGSDCLKKSLICSGGQRSGA
jgi:hypothetical protein